jgi:hypothetical protein
MLPSPDSTRALRRGPSARQGEYLSGDCTGPIELDAALAELPPPGNGLSTDSTRAFFEESTKGLRSLRRCST